MQPGVAIAPHLVISSNLILRNLERNITSDITLDNLLVFPSNETTSVFQKLVSSGEKLAFAGSNSEIDEVLLDLKNKYKITFFRDSATNLELPE